MDRPEALQLATPFRVRLSSLDLDHCAGPGTRHTRCCSYTGGWTPTESILVVDDRAIERRLLATLLGYRGYVVLEAADGAEALTLLQAKRPSLVITDILMPEMDGYELVRRVRGDPALRDLPMILYTATYGGQAAQTLAGACGATALLTKPADPGEILRAVETALGASAPASALPTDDFDRAHLRLVTDKLAEKVTELEAVNLRLAALVDFGQQLCAEPDVNMQIERASVAAAGIIRAHHAAVGLPESDGVTVRRFVTTESAHAAGRDLAHRGEPEGFQILLASTVHDALALLEEQCPTLIISDLDMPQQNGFDLIKAIKADRRWHDIPFVFLTSTCWAEREHRTANALGADRFISRPIDPRALLREIAACLGES